MKPLIHSLTMFIRQILRDNMLWVVCLAPLFTGLLFRFGIPYVESVLCEYFNIESILFKYYLLFDIVLCFITSYMFCFVSSMVMLTERDENMARYIAVTPVGKKGYVISRLIFQAIISIPISIILIYFFSLTKWNYLILLETSLMMAILSVAIALFIFVFSNNRVEGMAMAKMSGIISVGLFIPFFMMSNKQYFFSFLPSFWISKLSIEGRSFYIFPGLVVSAIWIWLLSKKFKKKYL